MKRPNPFFQRLLACLTATLSFACGATVYLDPFQTVHADPDGVQTVNQSTSHTIDLSDLSGLTLGAPIRIEFTADQALAWLGSFYATTGDLSLVWTVDMEITVGGMTTTFSDSWSLGPVPYVDEGMSIEGYSFGPEPTTRSVVVPWGTDLSALTFTLRDRTAILAQYFGEILSSTMNYTYVDPITGEVSGSGFTFVTSSEPVTNLTATFSSAEDVSVTAGSYNAANAEVNVILDFAPAPGTSLMVVRNTGLAFIQGTFSNLLQGQTVTLTHGGNRYNFVANYYGGTGNDLVLQWAGCLPVAWGEQKLDSREFALPFVAVAGGGTHSVALKADGTVAAWGNNEHGQAVPPAGLGGVTSISAGVSHSVALKSDGTVVAWGYNHYGQSTVPPGLGDVVAIAANGHHTVVLKEDGTITGWGLNDSGQTTPPVGLEGVTAIATGNTFTAALKSDGTVVAWGNNVIGQTEVPAGLGDVVAIATGTTHTVALREDGTVVAWGSNEYGETVVPAGLNGVVAVAAGDSHSVALKADGSVVVWGGNNFFGPANIPAGLTGVVAIASGLYHTLALKNDGTVIGFGFNNRGQTTVPDDLRGLVAIDASLAHTVGLKNDGSVVAWGSNYHGEAQVPAGLSGVVAIATGEVHSVALKEDGTVTAWGNNDYSQTMVPVGLSGVVALAASEKHTLALQHDGSVVIWGWMSNHPGPITLVPGPDAEVAIATGPFHTIGLNGDGTVSAWGATEFGQSTVPTGLIGVAGVAAGYYHSVAFKGDGSVVAWGHNNFGQTTVPVGLSGVLAVAAGRDHTVALKSNGAAVAWGRNDYGQSSVPAGLGGVTAIDAAWMRTAALAAMPPFQGVTKADGLTRTDAMLRGRVNPNSQPTTAFFEFGTTTSYGSTAAITLSADDGGTYQDVSAALTGLTHGTLYHYRLVTTNVVGTTTSADGTFMTVGDPDIALEQPEGSVLTSGGSLWFGEADVNGPPQFLDVVMRNTGSAELTGIGAAISDHLPSAFSIHTPPPATILPGAIAVMKLAFDPQAGGSQPSNSNHQAILSVTSNDPDESPFTLYLGGTGLHPNLSVSVGSVVEITGFPYNGFFTHAFGRAALGSSQSVTVTIRNQGMGLLTGNFSFGGSGFSVVGPPTFSLGSLDFQEYVVTFSPTTAGPEFALASISSNDIHNGSANLNFSGSGNSPPVVSDISASGSEDHPNPGIPINLPATDADGDAVIYEMVTVPQHGTVVGFPLPVFTYSTPAAIPVAYLPDADFHGNDSFSYRVWDGFEHSNVATVSISVTPVNDPPVAMDQLVATPEDTPLAVDLTALDVDDTELTYLVVTQPEHGTLDLSGAVATYTPDENYHGADSFTFKASDGHEYQPESQVATVTISVASVNDAPVTSFEIFSINEDQSLAVSLAKGVLKNDSDFHDGAPAENNSPLTAVAVDAPPHAQSFILNPDGTFSYTPRPDFHGLDSFTYRAVDALGAESEPETVLIAVRAVNDPPVGETLAVSTLEDVPVPIRLRGADVDAFAQFDPAEWLGLIPPASGPAPYDAALVFSITQSPAHGTLSGSGANLAYTPHPNFHGTDVFHYSVSDGLASSIEATVTITVQPDNDADLLPDSWEMVAFNSLVWDGGDDPDGDGQDNEFELIAGLDPNDANSRMILELAGPSPTDGIFRLNHVRPGVRYTLEASNGVGDWEVIADETYGIAGPGTIYDTRDIESDRQFYRVGVARE